MADQYSKTTVVAPPKDEEADKTVTVTPDVTRIDTRNLSRDSDKTQTGGPGYNLNKPDYSNQTIVNNRFLLESSLGSGGMGQVFRAKDLRRVEMDDSQPYVALKLLRMELQEDPSFIQALQRESKKAQRLAHPNIITVYDFDRDNDVAYISMEFLDGESLDKKIAGRAYSTKDALDIIDKMARGLAYAHQEGFVHADFKPANIFYTKEDQTKILDFGIAQAVVKDGGKYRSDVQTNNRDLTVSALTPNYASLEMIKGDNPLPVDDVYSLCCVAYEILTGKHPYQDEYGKKITARQAELDGMEPPILKGVPHRYARAIRKGLSLKRDERFDNAGEFLDATKPKITKTHVSVAAVFSFLSILLYFGTDIWQESLVPSTSELRGDLAPIAEILHQGDEMLSIGDVDFAHRLYAQAWDESTLKDMGSSETEILRRIVDDRMNKIAKSVINKINYKDDDLFTLQQYEIALSSLKRDALGTSDKSIDKALLKLKEQIDSKKNKN